MALLLALCLLGFGVRGEVPDDVSLLQGKEDLAGLLLQPWITPDGELSDEQRALLDYQSFLKMAANKNSTNNREFIVEALVARGLDQNKEPIQELFNNITALPKVLKGVSNGCTARKANGENAFRKMPALKKFGIGLLASTLVEQLPRLLRVPVEKAPEHADEVLAIVKLAAQQLSATDASALKPLGSALVDMGIHNLRTMSLKHKLRPVALQGLNVVADSFSDIAAELNNLVANCEELRSFLANAKFVTRVTSRYDDVVDAST